MRLVEKHIIKQSNRYYDEIDKLSFLSKNLYNNANYIVRQEFINQRSYLNYNTIQKQLQNHDDYKLLPAKVSQQVLKLLDKNWISFFRSIKDFKINPNKYKGRPKLPKYKHKTKGRNILVYTIQAISKKGLKKGFVKLSGTDIKIETNRENIQQVRIIPKSKEYIIEIIYEKEEIDLKLEKSNFMSIDIGLNNLATITSNKSGFNPMIINGRVLRNGLKSFVH